MIFKFFRSSRKLKEALARYASNPGIDETTAVVDLYFKAKNYAEAFKYADNGYQRFPSCQELLKERQKALKARAHGEYKQLKKRISRSPQPEIIAKAIEIQRSLGNSSRCEKLISRWANEFPNSWVLQFAVGKYLFQRSVIEKDPETSTECLKHLELAATLKPGDHKTLLYVATLHYQLRSLPEAVAATEKLLRRFPGDRHAVALLHQLRREFSKSTTETSVDPGNDPQHTQIALDAFEKTKEIDSVQASLFLQITEGGEKEYLHTAPELQDVTETSDLLRGLRHSLEISSTRMGIGDLTTCILDGETWNIFYCRIAGVTLLIYTTKAFQEGDFITLMKRLKPEKATA